MTVRVAKLNDKIVEIVRTADRVGFSSDRGWVLINKEVAKPNSLAVRWVPATTRFEWVREFHF
jgi:hypothetical protein